MEFSDETLWDHIDWATQEFNESYAPELDYTSDEIPFHILFAGTVVSLVNSTFLHGQRNSIQYSDGGSSFDFFGQRANAALRAIQKYEPQFDAGIRRFKAKLSAAMYSGSIF